MSGRNVRCAGALRERGQLYASGATARPLSRSLKRWETQALKNMPERDQGYATRVTTVHIGFVEVF